MVPSLAVLPGLTDSTLIEVLTELVLLATLSVQGTTTRSTTLMNEPTANQKEVSQVSSPPLTRTLQDETELEVPPVPTPISRATMLVQVETPL